MIISSVSVVYLVILFQKYGCFWPPPHEIHLENSETFEISELWEDDDLLGDEDEMIPIKTRNERPELFKLHQIAAHHNKREITEKKQAKNVTKAPEENFYLDEPVPWQAGFVDKQENFVQKDNENVYFLNEKATDLIEEKLEKKRQPDDQIEENYDFNSFKREYDLELEKAKQDNNTFIVKNTTEGNIEEIVGLATPKNCTTEEKKGIGFTAIKCIVKDLKTAKSTNTTLYLLEKIARISLIWFCVYLIIAVPCWCTRGWCCCCLKCFKICRPRENIEQAKQFFTNNPVGVFHTANGQKVQYQPTNYEIYTQNQLEKALFNL